MTTPIATKIAEPKQFPVLFKKTAAGKIQTWRIAVDVLPDGTANIITLHGLEDGKKTSSTDHIFEGKNIGRSNATDPVQQAYAEAEAKWVEKQERGHYGTDKWGSESAAKRASAPMLAEAYFKYDKKTRAFVRTNHVKKVDWTTAYTQPKLDGHRMLASSYGRLVSREGVDITEALPHISKAVIDLKLPDGTVLDGEVYKHGIAVTSIGGLISGRHAGALELEYHIYDAVSPMPFTQRRYQSDAIKPPLVCVPTFKVLNEAGLLTYQAQCIEQGYEGAMLRWGTLGYEAGKRSVRLLKVKNFVDDEFKVVGFKEGRGTYAGMAVFECVTSAGNSFEVTAPGNFEEKRKFFAHAQDYVGKMLTVKFSGYTAVEKPLPFHPIALHFRQEL